MEKHPDGNAKIDFEISKESNELIEKALYRATREALMKHKVAGNPIAVCEAGKLVIVEPEEILI